MATEPTRTPISEGYTGMLALTVEQLMRLVI